MLTNEFKVKNDLNTLGKILSSGIDIADIFAASNTSFTLSGYNATFLVPGNSTVSFQGSNGIDARANSSSRTITFSGINATSTQLGVASFSTDNFTVTNGAVIIKNGGIDNDELAGNINDTKLLTITATNKVSNSATTAISSNNPNTIVARGASGEFSSGSITATGNVSASQTVTGNILNAATGFTINNAATNGHILLGNGTNFVSSPLLVSDIGAGQALTRTNDTNVTITLGGAPSVALLSAVSLAVGWTGELQVTRGGTGTNNGSISGTGAMTFAAGGTNQDIFVRPSGTGSVNITKANIISGLTVAGNSTFSGTVSSSNFIDTAVGFRVGGAAAPGNVLRGNGTNFVASTLAAADIGSGQTLSTANDPNITLTASGEPLTALLKATTLTVAFSGILPVNRGGTGSSNGSITGSSALTFAAGGTNQDITLSPSGTGEVNIAKVDIDAGTIDGVSIGSAAAATIVNVDDLRLDGNTIASLNANNIALQPASGTTTATGNVSASQTVTGNILNAVTGFTINNAATNGHFLKGNGSYFVSTAVAAGDIGAGQALTKADDTNVTLTLSGSPSSALLTSVGMTLGWTGLLGLSRGGTNSNNGSITGSGALTFAAGGTNQDITLSPSGTGEVNIAKVDIDAGAIDGTVIGANSAAYGKFTNLDATGNVNIAGSLFIAGSATTINAVDLVLSDPMIFLAEGNEGDTVDIGFAAAYDYNLTPHKHTGFVRNNGTQIWTLFSGLTAEVLSATQINFNDPSLSIDTLQANLQGTVTGNVSGTANKANQFTTARTIALTGDVTYTSPAFDGTANVSGTATIANSAVNSDKILNGAVTNVKIADGAINAIKIANNTVSLDKIVQIAANTILGNATSSTGNVSTISCTAAGRALLDDASAADQRATLGLGTTDTVTFGEVVVNNGSRTVLRDVFSGTTGAGATTQTLDLFAAASYNSAKIHVQIKQDTGGSAKRCALEILMTKDIAGWQGTVYAIVDPSGIFLNVTETVDGGLLKLVFNYIGSNVYTATASVEAISD